MTPELIADYACTCGEGPMWHADEQQMYWTDIETGRFFRYDPQSGQHEQCYDGMRVGGFTIQADGSLLLFRDKGNIAVWRNGQIERTVVEAIEAESGGRFNDVIADPQGRVFAGTLTSDGSLGRLYRIDHDGSYTVIGDGFGCPNGMGFTPDLHSMYFTDSSAKTVYLFDYDRATGALKNRRVWHKFPDDGGAPDGMTVDREGNLWIAFWGGRCFKQFSADGTELQKIDIPAEKISSVTFAGNKSTDIYVTTAGGNEKENDGEFAGSLFRVKSNVKGVPEFLSAICLEQ